MSRYYFDIETNGFLEHLTTIHSLVLKDMDSGELISCTSKGVKRMSIQHGLNLLASAEEIVGHNIMAFDIPAIRKLHPKWNPTGKITDTLVLSRLVFADMKERDFAVRDARKRKGWSDAKIKEDFPGQHIGNHGLESWGYRLRMHKGDYSKEMKAKGLDPWAEWNPAMQRYCEQDVELTEAVHKRILKEASGWPDFEQSAKLEHDVHAIILRQEAYGFLFDMKKARKLEAELTTRRAELVTEIATYFRPWAVPLKPMDIKRKLRRFVKHPEGGVTRKGETGYWETRHPDCPCDEVVIRVFNPSSRQHISDRLQKLYGWKPKRFTPGGEPAIDEDTLGALKYPPAKLLAELFTIDKRLGALCTGAQNWMGAVRADGRVHCRVNSNGAVTGRMTHMAFNIAQVPAINNAKGPVPYGRQCRELFCVPKGKVQVGVDGASLELVCLAHFLARWDGGAFAVAVSTGDKSQGTDPHSLNREAAGLDTRDQAKTFIYAFLYGAGDEKLGSIVAPKASRAKQRKIGAELKARFFKRNPAIKKLVDAVKKAAKKNKALRGMDGRMVPVRSDHAALNTLLQHTGAIIMKIGLVILDADLQEAGLVPGLHYEFIANVHDEWQMEVDEDKAEQVKAVAIRAIEKAGDRLNLQCPVTGDGAIGKNWAETH